MLLGNTPDNANAYVQRLDFKSQDCVEMKQ